MNVDLGIWGKLTRIVIGLLVIALLGILWQWYLPNIKQNERMRRNAFGLELQIQKEEATQKQLKASIDTLRYDLPTRTGTARAGKIALRQTRRDGRCV